MAHHSSELRRYTEAEHSLAMVNWGRVRLGYGNAVQRIGTEAHCLGYTALR